MKKFKYEDIKYKNYVIGKKITISLTSEFSHEAKIELGQGSFCIGAKGIDEEYKDVLVDKDDKIYWSSFNDCETIFRPIISEKIKWPRFFSYTGNDIGFINWSKTRKIEDFTWSPQKEMVVDFTDANIFDLSIKSLYKLELLFGENIYGLNFYGNPNNFIIKKCLNVTSLGFYPQKDDTIKVYRLPKYECFRNVERILVEVNPNGAPFDCSSLLQFPNLKSLYLVGNMTNLSSLKELKYLKKLGLWDIPELSDLPNLVNWKMLDDFVAMNIDENKGKLLKEEIKELKKERKFEFASVCKLRNKLWFETEYGLPFSSWDSKKEKKATLVYKKCLKKIKTATSKSDIKDAIIEYTNKFNKMDDIETIEREDTYTALSILMKNSPIKIEHDTWQRWFDDTRDF